MKAKFTIQLRNYSNFQDSSIEDARVDSLSMINGGNYLGVHQGKFAHDQIDGVKITKLEIIRLMQ